MPKKFRTPKKYKKNPKKLNEKIKQFTYKILIKINKRTDLNQK